MPTVYAYKESISCPVCNSSFEDLAGDYVVHGRHAFHGEEVFEECPECGNKVRIVHLLDDAKVEVRQFKDA